MGRNNPGSIFENVLLSIASIRRAFDNAVITWVKYFNSESTMTRISKMLPLSFYRTSGGAGPGHNVDVGTWLHCVTCSKPKFRNGYT